MLGQHYCILRALLNQGSYQGEKPGAGAQKQNFVLVMEN